VLHDATDIVGYTSVCERRTVSVTATRHPAANGVEVERASDALRMATDGKRVAVVSVGMQA